MKASLQLNLGQQLTLTPQLQQAIRLLQLSTLDLNHEIQEFAEANPMVDVEEADESTPNFSQSTTLNTGNAPISRGGEMPNYENMLSTTESLQDHLIWQMGLTPMSDIDQLIATTIIDTINDDGLVTSSMEDIQAALPKAENLEPIGTDEIEAVLHRIQRFDPIGCGARTIGECLDVQLSQLPENTPGLRNARRIVNKYIDFLGNRNYTQLMRKMKIKQSDLSIALSLIQTLNPRPGSLIDSQKTEYIIPDALVKKIDGHWKVQLNQTATPKIKINQQYAGLIQRADKSPDNTFLRTNLQDARWFIKSIQSRHDTLLRVAKCIVEHQQEFLEHGEESMKPLILHDVADALELHESTISRVTTQKYLHTPRGVFELKYFFSSHVSTRTGGECSSTAIRAVIKKLVAAENTSKPLSDNKIAQLLGKQGVKVARRTIAKYREALSIPPSNERKTITY